MDFLDKQIQKYAEAHTSAEIEILRELNRETYLKVLRPRMLSGHLQGRILSMFSTMLQPSTILEIGTYTGYSAICLAEGLKENGQLITIDVNEELEDFARKYFDKSGYGDRIQAIIGDALEVIPTLDYQWDLVFIDADKVNYAHYYNLVMDKVRKGGYIIADNVLWSGKVVEEIDGNDKDTPALIEFNKKVHEDNRVENLLLPVRDGLMILRKK